LLTAPPAIDSAAQLFPALNSGFSDFLDDANPELMSTFSSAVSGMSAMYGAITEARNQILGLATLTNIDPTMLQTITNITPTVSSIFGSTNTLPDATLLQSFALGEETSSSDENGSVWQYGTTGNLQFDSNNLVGSANSYVVKIEPINGTSPSLILVGSGDIIVMYGAPSMQFNVMQMQAWPNGNYDQWYATFNIDANGRTGQFSRSIKQGPIVVSAGVNWLNSQVTSRNATVDVVLTDQEFHAEYDWSQNDTFRKMTYHNYVDPNMTVLAEYASSSSQGTNLAAGIGLKLSDKCYIESMLARYTPISGTAQTAALIQGALRTNTAPLALVFSSRFTNGVADPNNSSSAFNEINMLQKDPLQLRLQTASDFHNLKDTTFSADVMRRY